MSAILLLLVCFLLFPAPAAGSSASIDSTKALLSILTRPEAGESAFCFEAMLPLGCPAGITAFAVSDAGGNAILHKNHNITSFCAEAGDIVRASGYTRKDKPNDRLYACCTNIVYLRRSKPPPIPDVSPEDLWGEKYDFRPIHMTGVVRDVMQDEIDPGYIFLVLNCRGEFIFTPIAADGPLADSPENLIGSRIELTGVCDPLHVGSRMQIGKLVYSLRSRDIKLTKADKQALFNVPDISGLINRSPLEISKKDRHRTHGKVIAVYRKNLILVKTPSGQIVGAELADVPAPRFGQTVDLTGFPQSDLYHVNLARALWRPSLADADVPEDPVTDIGPAHRLMTDDEGRLCYNPGRHGTTVKCRGTVCSRLRLKDQNAIVNLQSGSSILSVDVSSLPQIPPEISVGCEIEVTGTCILESEHWRPNMIFPKITQALIVPRSESDMVIIARPPWWTPGRLLLVISALLLALVAILAWNASLKVLAAKRGRELFKSQIAKVSSELRVSERTRLAVELHDSITQNLTGVTLQIDAAASARREDPAEAERILCVARRSLQSCLDELRRCLWDLRSEALEEQDFNTAIRIALKQVAGKSDIAIRFNISRNRLSDATAHAILRIIRELVSNAIRHGRADKIRIIGESLPNMIRFAVSDNGCGFDPATVPGPGDGHFGLSGIRERLKDIQGTLRLTSTPKGGTRAEIVIPLHCSPSS